MIEISGLTKKFDKITALDALDLTVQNGSVTGLIGSNGGGKSTLLRILAGVFRHQQYRGALPQALSALERGGV